MSTHREYNSSSSRISSGGGTIQTAWGKKWKGFQVFLPKVVRISIHGRSDVKTLQHWRIRLKAWGTFLLLQRGLDRSQPLTVH